MTPEEVKKQLGQYRKIRDECERLRGRIEDKREDMNYLKAVVSDGISRSGGMTDNVERAVEQIDALISFYTNRIVEREAAELRVLKIIESVDEPDGRSILFLHYIEGKKFEDIADELHISSETMWRKYREAVKLLKNDSE